jgi:S1-C subfamily serine protease
VPHLLKSLCVASLILLSLFAGRARANHPAVVRVTVPMPEGARALGSGVLAGADERFGYVLTAHHVVKDAEGQPKVRFANGNVQPGHILKTDSAADLAVIRIDRPEIPPVEWAVASPTKGDELVAAGFGSNGKYQEATGPLVGFSARTDDTPDWMILQAQVRSGDSGGPVFTKDGKLAGVLWGCNDNTYASPVARLYTFTQKGQKRLFPIRRALSRLRG